MSAVRAHAGGDSKAESELLQEEMARQQHFAMLEFPLVADLLDADSLILEDELAAVMLSEQEGQVIKALDILEQEQRFLLAEEAMQLLQQKGLSNDLNLRKRVELIRASGTE